MSKIRHVQPLGPRVLVRLSENADRSPGGLFLPQGVKESYQEANYAQVIEVARAKSDDDLGENVSGIPLHSWVLFPKECGLTLPWDDRIRLVNTKDIMAIVEEIDAQEIH
jgi:co-chaperonin GroES (HSP10)